MFVTSLHSRLVIFCLTDHFRGFNDFLYPLIKWLKNILINSIFLLCELHLPLSFFIKAKQ